MPAGSVACGQASARLNTPLRLSRTDGSNPSPSSGESGANHGAAEATWAQPDASHTIIFIAGLEDHRVPLWARKLQLEVFSFRRSRRYDNESSLCPLKGYHPHPEHSLTADIDIVLAH